MKEMKKLTKYQEVLSQLFLFQGIGARIVREAFDSPLCVCRQYEPGELVYGRDFFQQSLGVVLSGELKAVKPSMDGGGIYLNTFPSGSAFGAAALFHLMEQYVSEITAVKRSKVLFLPQKLLRGLFRLEPQVAENYIAYLSDRICFLNSRIEDVAGGTAESRLAGYLLSLFQEDGPELELPLPMTRLATVLHLGRASLYRAFGLLEERGVIKRQGKQVFIRDPRGLSWNSAENNRNL